MRLPITITAYAYSDVVPAAYKHHQPIASCIVIITTENINIATVAGSPLTLPSYFIFTDTDLLSFHDWFAFAVVPSPLLSLLYPLSLVSAVSGRLCPRCLLSVRLCNLCPRCLLSLRLRYCHYCTSCPLTLVSAVSGRLCPRCLLSPA